jgi:predicted dienelactone hydrolase
MPRDRLTRRGLKISSVGLSVCSLLIILSSPLLFAQSPKPSLTAPFISPSGPFAVGTHEYLWVDQNREEPFTKDPADRRHLLVRVWYPADKTDGASEPALYVRDVNEFSEKSVYRRGEGFKTNSITDAALAKGTNRLPVLIYQPGGGTARFIGTFVTEQLASAGYIVFSADHAGFSDTVLYPDGYRFQADALLMPKPIGTLRDDALKNWEWLEKVVFPTWKADVTYILDKIEELDRTPGQYHKRIDLSRIGMLGWSFGGATAVQMSKDDRRIKAVVDQDGQLFGDVSEKGTGRPVMLMHHGNEDKPPKPSDAEVMKELIAMTRERDRSFLDRSTNDRYEITISKTQHGHFSDFLLFFPPRSDELDARRAHEIIVTYTLAFFDKYLRARDSAFLSGPSDKYPEVTFQKRTAQK